MKRPTQQILVGLLGSLLVGLSMPSLAAVDSQACKNLGDENCVVQGDDGTKADAAEKGGEMALDKAAQKTTGGKTTSMLLAQDLKAPDTGVDKRTNQLNKKAKKSAEALAESTQFQRRADEITRQSLIYNTVEFERLRKDMNRQPNSVVQ